MNSSTALAAYLAQAASALLGVADLPIDDHRVAALRGQIEIRTNRTISVLSTKALAAWCLSRALAALDEREG